MTARIPVYLKHTNTSTNTDDLLLPVTTADQIEESSDKQFISQAEKATLSNKQDNLGYTPVNKAGDTLNGPLILSSDAITDARQAVTKSYVDLKVAELVNSAPAALDTINELASAIGNDPNFAVSIASVVGNKLDKTAASAVAEANKLLYLDSDRNLNANAATATKIKIPITLTLTGDVTGSASIDGSQDVSLETSIPDLDSLLASGLFTLDENLDLMPGSYSSENGNIIIEDKIYDAMTLAELNTGTQTTPRVISPQLLASYVTSKVGSGSGSGSGGGSSTIITGTTNGTINVDGIDVAVYGLKSAAYSTADSFLAVNGTAADSNKLGGTVASNYALKTDIPIVPTFATVATSGDYGDLLNKPSIPANTSDLINDSGFITGIAWDDISSKPTIPSKVSDLTNDSGFITGVAWNDVTSKPSFATVATSGSYTDLLDTPTIPTNVSDLTNDSGFITGIAWDDISSKPTFATVATSGSYIDLSNKPTIPTKVSDLTNDSGFLASVAWNDISSKPSFATVAISGSYNDLSNTPTIPSKVSDLSNDSGFITGIAWNDVTNKPSTFEPSSHNHVVSDITDFPTIPTYSNFVGSGSTASSGLVPAPSTIAGTDKYLREDGTWAIPPNNSAAYTNFVGSGSAAAAGLVPQPPTTAGSTKYLCENGTWAIPPGASYSDFVGSGSTAAAGLVPSPGTTAGTTKYLCEDGNWSVPSFSVSWSDVSGKPSTFDPTSHTHVGSEITLTGYSIASSASSVAATDTLNEALGKLQKSIDGKQASGSYAASSHTHDDYVPTSRTVNSKALSSNISLTASDVGAADATHLHVGSDITLTGYSKAASASAVAATDTVNGAIGKIEKAIDGKQAAGNYVTTDTDQNITGVKTFVGTKKIKLKQSNANDKLGFTLYDNSDTEKGYLEFNPTNTIDGVAALMTLGNYATADDGLSNVGFRRYSGISGADGAYNLLAPLISNAKTPFSLTKTYTNFYLLLGITDGTTMLKANNAGVINISSILPTVPTNVSDLNNDSGYITGIAWDDILSKPSTFTPASHNHPSSEVNLMTGYSKPNATSDIAITDTLNEAIGKLEKALDGKQASGNYLSTSGTAADSSKLGGTAAANYALKTDIPTVPTKVSDLTNDSGFITGIAWNDVSSKPSVFTPDAHNQASNTINALTGYSKPNVTSALSTSDSLNDALGKLEKALDEKQASGSYLTTTGTAADSSKLGGTAAASYALKTDIPSVPTKVSDLSNDSGFITSVSWSDISSKPSTFAPESHNQASSTINTLTGYDKSVTGGTGALGTSDTLNKALAKLENALDGKQASGSYLTTTGTAADSNKLGGTAAANYALKTDIPTVFVGSGSTAASGLVPAPSTTAGTSKYLCEDGNWAVPAGTYSHPTTSGNKHIPSGGSTGQILKWSADGTAIWANETTGSGGTYTNFVGSGPSAASGLVPKPSTTAGTTKFLREDGYWEVPPNTTYSIADASNAGIVKLYSTSGNNTDGTMTQAAIASAITAAINAVGSASSMSF